MTRLMIEPLTRVEGHGRIELVVNRGRLQTVRVDLNESPRLFEAMLLGRDWREVPELVCRICGICSAVHKLTALAALEQAIGISVPPAAAAVRELLLLGGHIQSHALHLFCLVLPDFYGAVNVVELVRARNPLALAGLELKSLGNRLQELFGGRVVHSVNVVPGGVAHRPTQPQLQRLLEELQAWSGRWPRLSADFTASARYPAGRQVIGNFLATGQHSGFSLTGDRLWMASGEVLPVSQYRRLLGEKPSPHSHAKQAAAAGGPFLVGALARLKLAEARRAGPDFIAGSAVIYDNNTAQLEETGWALDRAVQLVAHLAAMEPDSPLAVREMQPRAGAGTAACEAPRGLLVHHYVLNDEGRVLDADVVTPTAINQLAMAEQIRQDLAEVNDAALMPAIVEQLVRAYDPCISCAVHVLDGVGGEAGERNGGG